MAKNFVDLIRELKPEIEEDRARSIGTIMESHIQDSDANQNTVPMSLHILTRLAENHKDLNFSPEKGILNRKQNVSFLVDFDLSEYALVADPFKMIENALINDCIRIIEEDLAKSKMKTLTSSALIYDIAEIKDGSHRFEVKLNYGLK